MPVAVRLNGVNQLGCERNVLRHVLAAWEFLVGLVAYCELCQFGIRVGVYRVLLFVALEVGVVRHHYKAVFCHMQVELEVADAYVYCVEHCRNGVFGVKPGSAAVGYDGYFRSCHR